MALHSPPCVRSAGKSTTHGLTNTTIWVGEFLSSQRAEEYWGQYDSRDHSIRVVVTHLARLGFAVDAFVLRFVELDRGRDLRPVELERRVTAGRKHVALDQRGGRVDEAAFMFFAPLDLIHGLNAVAKDGIHSLVIRFHDRPVMFLCACVRAHRAQSDGSRGSIYTSVWGPWLADLESAADEAIDERWELRVPDDAE